MATELKTEDLEKQLESMLDIEEFPPPEDFRREALVTDESMYDEAAKDLEGFWSRQAKELIDWAEEPSETLDESNAPFYKWFADGKLNASYNCLDRNLQNGNAEKTAIIFEADDGAVTRVTYRELHARVCKFANALKARGIKKPDRVVIYM